MKGSPHQTMNPRAPKKAKAGRTNLSAIQNMSAAIATRNTSANVLKTIGHSVYGIEIPVLDRSFDGFLEMIRGGALVGGIEDARIGKREIDRTDYDDQNAEPQAPAFGGRVTRASCLYRARMFWMIDRCVHKESAPGVRDARHFNEELLNKNGAFPQIIA